MTKEQASALILAQTKLVEHLTWALIEVRDAAAGRVFDADEFSERVSDLEGDIQDIIDDIPDDPAPADNTPDDNNGGQT